SALQQTSTDYNLDSGSGQAICTFTIAAPGDYTLDAMVNAPSQIANSFFLNVDAQPQNPTMVWDIPLTSGFDTRTAAWRGNGSRGDGNPSGDPAQDQFMPKVFTFTAAGNHQLIVRGREANTQVQSF